MLAWIAVALSVSLLVAAISNRSIGADFVVGDLFRDPAAITKLSALAGAASTLGLLLWAGAAATCFTGAMLLRQVGSSKDSTFLFATGALILVALLDDAYLLHERVGGRYLGGEEIFLVLYLVLGALWLVAFLPELRESDVPLLLIVLVAFAVSVVVDIGEYRAISEDVLELIGTCALVLFCFREVKRRIGSSTTFAR